MWQVLDFAKGSADCAKFTFDSQNLAQILRLARH